MNHHHHQCINLVSSEELDTITVIVLTFNQCGLWMSVTDVGHKLYESMNKFWKLILFTEHCCVVLLVLVPTILYFLVVNSFFLFFLLAAFCCLLIMTLLCYTIALLDNNSCLVNEVYSWHLGSSKYDWFSLILDKGCQHHNAWQLLKLRIVRVECHQCNILLKQKSCCCWWLVAAKLYFVVATIFQFHNTPTAGSITIHQWTV